MLTDVKQNELDLAEEVIFTTLFGSPTINTKTELLLNLLDIDINKHIQRLETFVKTVMDSKGYIDSALAKKAVAIKYPSLANLIPNNNFRLVDAATVFSNIVKGVIEYGRAQ